MLRNLIRRPLTDPEALIRVDQADDLPLALETLASTLESTVVPIVPH